MEGFDLPDLQKKKASSFQCFFVHQALRLQNTEFYAHTVELGFTSYNFCHIRE